MGKNIQARSSGLELRKNNLKNTFPKQEVKKQAEKKNDWREKKLFGNIMKYTWVNNLFAKKKTFDDELTDQPLTSEYWFF